MVWRLFQYLAIERLRARNRAALMKCYGVSKFAVHIVQFFSLLLPQPGIVKRTQPSFIGHLTGAFPEPVAGQLASTAPYKVENLAASRTIFHRQSARAGGLIRVEQRASPDGRSHPVPGPGATESCGL